MKPTLFLFFCLCLALSSCGSDTTSEEQQDSDEAIASSISQQLEGVQVTYLRPADEALIDEGLQKLRDSLIFYLNRGEAVAVGRFLASSFSWKQADSTLTASQTQSYLAADTSLAKHWAYLLSRGGAFEGKDRQRFRAPYWQADFPQVQAVSSLGFVDGENVSFRTAPNINAPLINRLSYEVVQQLPLAEDKLVYETHNDQYAPWLLVRVLETEKEGYLFGAFYQAIQTDVLWFEKEEGQWRLASVQSPAI